MDGLTFLVAHILLQHFLGAGRSYPCFINCPNIRKYPPIKLRIFLKYFYGQSKHNPSFGHPAENGEST